MVVVRLRELEELSAGLSWDGFRVELAFWIFWLGGVPNPINENLVLSQSGARVQGRKTWKSSS